MRYGRKGSSEWIMRSLALPRIGGNDMEENLSRKTIVRFVQSLNLFVLCNCLVHCLVCSSTIHYTSVLGM